MQRKNQLCLVYNVGLVVLSRVFQIGYEFITIKNGTEYALED